MHGRKKTTLSADQTAAIVKKSDTLRKLSALAIKNRNAHNFAPDAAKLNGELLGINPDIYSLWNQRREVFISKIASLAPADTKAAGVTAVTTDNTAVAGSEPSAASAADEPSAASAADGVESTAALDALRGIVAEELKISAAGIARNPKSYPAWHHRQWVVARHPGAVDFERELGLCGKLLDADERNFHCWNYRRWMVGVAREQQAQAAAAAAPASTEAAEASVSGSACAGSGAGAAASASQFSAASELAYTLERIRRNFSNYSAWHYRSVLLLQVGSVAAEEAPAAAVGAPSTAPRTAAAPATGAATAAAGPAPASVARGLQPLALSLAREELQLVKRALYTEPDDQSGWFYHRWLVDRVRDTAAAAATGAAATSPTSSCAGLAPGAVGDAPAATAAARCSGGVAADGLAAQHTLEASAAALLLEDAGALLELSEAEPGSKWPRLALAHVFQAFQRTPGLVAAAERARAGGLAPGAVPPSSAEAALISKGVAALFAGASSPAVGAAAAASASSAAATQAPAAAAAPLLPSIVAMYDAAAAADPIHTACYRSLAQSRGRH